MRVGVCRLNRVDLGRSMFSFFNYICCVFLVGKAFACSITSNKMEMLRLIDLSTTLEAQSINHYKKIVSEI